MIRDTRTYLLHMAGMLALTVGTTAISSCGVRLWMGEWPLWEQLFTMSGIMVAIGTVVLTYRYFTEWSFYDDDDE